MPRTVVIGGVGPTIGESVARRFAREGDRVALWARSESFTEQLAAELRAETPGDAVAVAVDVTDPEAVRAGVETVHEAFGTVDVYVHNTPAGGLERAVGRRPRLVADAAGDGRLRVRARRRRTAL
jgi:Short-chain alcohol dehydrogenase of unknown specificity